MSFRFPLILLVAGPAARLAAESFAPAYAEVPVQLAPVDVTADPSRSLTVPSLVDARETLARTPGGIEVVDAARFTRGRASTVEDTFALSAGVIAQSRFGSDEARLSIRGSGLQRTFHGRGLRVLQDGVPVNLADGSFDMQALEPLAAAYINVWRGANALAQGSSTLGGAIDYVSRPGRGSPPLSTRLEIGSWNYLRATTAAGGAQGDRDAFLTFTHASQDGFRDHAEQESQRLFANAGLRLSRTAETRVYVTGVRSKSELPGNLTRAELSATPEKAAALNLALDQRRDFDLLRVASKTAVRTGETAWDFTAAWTYKDLDHPIAQVIDQLTNDLLVGATATHATRIGGQNHELRAGAALQRGRINAANFVNAAGRRTALVSQATQVATNLEAFFEDQVSLSPRLTLALGVSAAANRRASDQSLGPTPDYILHYHRVMPKLGLRYDLRDAQFFANVSGSYEPPSFSETLTLNTARDAQTARTLEIGSRGARGPVRWEASLYRAQLRGELLSLDHDGNPATPATTLNANRTMHEGVELGAEVDLFGGAWETANAPANRLVFRTAWTHGRFRFDEDPRYHNNALAGLPPHLIRAELTWESARGWYFGPTCEWSPRKSFVDFRNTLSADPYAIMSLRLGRRTAHGLSWFIECRNLTDRRYAATTGVIENAAGLDQPQFLPGDGRGFFAGIDHAW